MDAIRASITFNNPYDLLNGVRFFCESVESKKTSLKGIARIKNSFQKIESENLNEFNVNNPRYAQIIVNVIVERHIYKQNKAFKAIAQTLYLIGEVLFFMCVLKFLFYVCFF